MNAIETYGLTKRYGTQEAVKNLNLIIPEGSICGFLGKNGAGKTTTIKMLVGLSRPTSGEIFIQEQKRIYEKQDNSIIGYLPDVPSFYNYFTAREYLDFCGRLYGLKTAKRDKCIQELLERVGLKDTKTAVSGYSRGMKQRLGIAQALMNSPKIIFLDEPISALDPIGRHEVMELIQSLRGHVTVFFSTHILSDVENTCDYAVIMDRGKLILSDTVENIKIKYSGNVAFLRLYSSEESDRFLQAIANCGGITYEKCGLREFKLYTNNLISLSKKLPELLIKANAALENYQVYTPTLEEIFMEVTSNE
jgi:ABC-2 type transport system ATP-binding protein